MARQPSKKEKIDWNMVLPYTVIFGISCSLYGLYINHLYARIFTSAALIDQDVIGAAAPFSYRLIARFFVGASLYAFPFLITDGFKERPSKWLWIIACLLAIPQLHGKTCLYEDGRLVTSMPLGFIRCEHTLSEVTLAEIEVSGRSSSHSRRRDVPVTIAADMNMTLHIPCGDGEDVFTFGLKSFRGEEENDQLIQMVRLRRQLPAESIVVEPYTDQEMKEMLDDEKLKDANPALVKEMLKASQ